jgi:hypothetical protein
MVYFDVRPSAHHPTVELRVADACTEPWIAAAAVTTYGHPVHDRELLAELSPLRRIEKLAAPVLVVHGVNDTTVPIGEARRSRRRGCRTRSCACPTRGTSSSGTTAAAVTWRRRSRGSSATSTASGPERQSAMIVIDAAT